MLDMKETIFWKEDKEIAQNCVEHNSGSILGLVENEFYQLRFELWNSNTEIRATIKPKEKGNFITPASLLHLLKSYDVKGAFDHKLIRLFCKNACNGQRMEDMRIVRSTPPKKGNDGVLKFVIRPEIKGTSENVKTPHLLTSVGHGKGDSLVAGQLVAILVTGEEGWPGKDVFGNFFPATKGKNFPIEYGKNIEYDPIKRRLYAKIPGRATFIDGVLDVSDTLTIDGSISWSSGKLTFPGNIVINGDVPDKVKITADNNIIVHGLIGASEIKAGGNIIAEGIVGREKANLKAGGDLKVRYADRCLIATKGDVCIQNEAVACSIKAEGAIRIANGRLIGGNSHAFEGMEVGTVGSDTWSNGTRIMVGRVDNDEPRLNNLRKKVEFTKWEMGTYKKRLANFMRNGESIETRPLKEQRFIQKLARTLKELIEEHNQCETEITQLVRKRAELSNPTVLIRKQVWPGTIVTIGKTSSKLKATVNGPISISENTEEKTLMFSRYQPLPNKMLGILQEISNLVRGENTNKSRYREAG